MLAGSGRYDASSVNYGDVPKDALDLLAGSCPVVGSFGGRDLTLRKAPDRLAAALDAVGVDHDIHVYPEAGHAFLNDHVRSEVPRWAVVMGALSNSDYHEPSARHARERIASFFAEHLTPADVA
jgi:carboxymethylenebutenolidase